MNFNPTSKTFISQLLPYQKTLVHHIFNNVGDTIIQKSRQQGKSVLLNTIYEMLLNKEFQWLTLNLPNGQYSLCIDTVRKRISLSKNKGCWYSTNLGFILDKLRTKLSPKEYSGVEKFIIKHLNL